MVHFLALLNRFQCPAIHFAVAGFIAAPAIALMPMAAQANEYSNCSQALLNTGLTSDQVTTACAKALHPETVSSCVVDVTAAAAVDPTVALAACSRDRRPDEMATCVTSIHQNLSVTDSALVVKDCNLSILPVRYAECVVGLGQTVDLTAEASLAQCIAAGYEPVDLAPSFIPMQ